MQYATVAYCDQCGFYYDTAQCVTCEDGDVQKEAVPNVVNVEEREPYTARWITILIFFGLLLIFAWNIVEVGLQSDVVFSYVVAVVLYAVILDWEMRCIIEFGSEGMEWDPDPTRWRWLAAGMILSIGVISVFVTPYYLYMRYQYVSFKTAEEI